MKNNITFILFLNFCFIAIASHGQTSKGSFLLGGSVEFSTHASTLYGSTGSLADSKAFTLSLQPSLSYFIIDRLAVGLITPYTYSRVKSKYSSVETKSTSQTYSVGPTARYYFPLGSQWAIFPEVSYSYGWNKDKDPVISLDSYGVQYIRYVESTDKVKNFQGGVGLVYFLNPNIGVEGKAFYQNQHTTYSEGSGSYDRKSTDIPTFNFAVGVQIYFAKSSQ